MSLKIILAGATHISKKLYQKNSSWHLAFEFMKLIKLMGKSF